VNSKKELKLGLFENDPCANFKKGVRGVGHFFRRRQEGFIIIYKEVVLSAFINILCKELNGKPRFTI
jgi:hypothetical protein